MQSGLAGINRGLDGVQKAAAEIASSGRPAVPEEATGVSQAGQATVTSEEQLLALVEAKSATEANVQTVKAVTAAQEALNAAFDVGNGNQTGQVLRTEA